MLEAFGWRRTQGQSTLAAIALAPVLNGQVTPAAFAQDVCRKVSPFLT